MSTTALSDLPRQRFESEQDDNAHLIGKSNHNMDSRRRVTEFVIVVVVVVAVGGLILALVSLAKPGHLEVEYEQEFNGPGFGVSQEKIWTFAVGHDDINLSYLDEETGTMKGYNVDVINAVCKIANKNCELIHDLHERCWTSVAGEPSRGGVGLLGGWYDVCAGWGNSYDRARVFSFSKPYSKLAGVALYVANSTQNFDWTDLTGRRIGFVDGFSSDIQCLSRYAKDLIQGAKGVDVSYFSSADKLAAAVIDGTVDAAFCYGVPQLTSQLKRVTSGDFPNRCALGGFGMMARKDNPVFLTWWNNAFDKLVKTAEYRMICADLKEAHGHMRGRNPDEVCL